MINFALFSNEGVLYGCNFINVMRIALLGDMAMFGSLSLDKDPELLEKLGPMSRYLDGFDMVVGNLESPFTRKRKKYGAKSGYVGSDPLNIGILKALHISAVNLANNHMYDFGPEGLNTTIDILEANGIPWFGVDGKDLRIESKGARAAFHGFCCYSTNPLKLAPGSGKKGINRVNFREMEHILQRDREEGLLSVLCVHSGIEHVSRPSLDQIMMSRRFAEIGPYVWWGHHPHVVQGVDVFKESVLAHSLGNFLFPEYEGDDLCPRIELKEENRIGLVLELEVEGNRLKGCELTYTRLNLDHSLSISKRHDLTELYRDILEEAFSNPVSYERKRLEQRKDFTDKRKQLRNFKWYMKRLRPRYVRLILDYRANMLEYERNVRNFIN